MVPLGDYLGHLLAEITRGRLQSDLEAVRIAELYGNHELLKHFPVPRIRLRDIDLDVPVVIVRDQGTDEGKKPPPSIRQLGEAYERVTRKRLSADSLRLTAPQLKALSDALKKKASELTSMKEASIDTNEVAKKLGLVVYEHLDKAGHKAPASLKRLNQEARIAFLNMQPPPARILVGVTTAELKEAPTESVTRISLRISEEGVEWTNISTDEHDEDRLVPE